MTMPTRGSRDRDNFHARVFKAISLSETRIKSTYISGLPMFIANIPLAIIPGFVISHYTTLTA